MPGGRLPRGSPAEELGDPSHSSTSRHQQLQCPLLNTTNSTTVIIIYIPVTLRHTDSAMSVSSQTTLISPSAKHTNPPLHRKPSQHARRRASLHVAHPHAHAHTSAHAHGRRGSEGESGRRALAAGLAMHTLDQGKKKKQGDVSIP